MFARILEMRTKRGQARGLCTAIEQRAMPIVGKYAGFVDGLCLISEEMPDSVLAVSFWQDREAAEKFRIQGYPGIAEIYLPFLDGAIRVRGYEVPVALTYQAQAAKAS